MGDDDLALNGYKAPGHPTYWKETVRKRLLNDIVKKMKLSPEQHVLDVGCGTGMILREIAPKVAHVTGVDFSAGMLAIARKNLPTNVTLKQMNAADLSLEEETFDRVLCYHVITNFLDDHFTRSVLIQLVRVTRKGGFVLIGNTPDYDKKDEQTKLIQQQWQAKGKLLLCRSVLSSLVTRCRNMWSYRILQRSVQPSLGNRFYTKDFFREFARETSCEIEILPLHVEGYIYAPYRFDVCLWPL